MQINLVSVTGSNTPPAQYGATGARYIVVGSSPTTGSAFVNHAGELAEVVGDGTYKFMGKAEMPQHTYVAGGVLYTYSGSAFVAVPTVATTATRTIHTEYFNRSSTFGTVAGSPPTLVATAAAIGTATDAENHTVGIAFPDDNTSWAHFGFRVPYGCTGDITPSVCFIVAGAPVALDGLQLSVIGKQFVSDEGSAGTTSAFSVNTLIDMTTYAAADYVIVPLTALGITATAGSYVQGVLSRDARVGNVVDIYADSITVCWVSFDAAVAVG